jgi:hypothetical protein
MANVNLRKKNVHRSFYGRRAGDADYQPLGLGLLGWLIYTLKNAVAAQKNTIDAQEAHIKSMASVMSMFDAPAMAARVEAYRKLTEDERDAMIKAAERKFQQTLTESTVKAEDKVRTLAMMYHKQTALYFEAVGVLAVYFKFHSPDWQLLKHSLSEELRQLIEEVMNKMPVPAPLPPPPPLPPISISSLKDRMTEPDAGRK